MSTLTSSFPDDASTKTGKCVESVVLVAVTPTSAAAPAVNDPAFTQAVSVPSEDKT